MYGLPQAGMIVQQLLEVRLNDERYRQSDMVPGLWTPGHVLMWNSMIWSLWIVALCYCGTVDALLVVTTIAVQLSILCSLLVFIAVWWGA